MNDTVITVENISKAYRLGQYEKHDTLFGAVVALLKAPLHNLHQLRGLDTSRMDREDGASDNVLWALRDVSFEVKRGDVLGIIGRNGAGKSTLLKILSRIAEPTCGRGEVHGRVSALLEVGTGFHPELTGRENIYLNGTILGMKKVEIDRKFDEIVDFSGVERFLDTPVKRYSSGMTVRLAFAVAAHLEPEVLIIDEVLAVGDSEFQKKCLGKMHDVATGEGRTVLFVSHNMAAVKDLCTSCICVENGRIADEGPASRVVGQYLANVKSTSTDSLAERKERGGSGPLRFTEIEAGTGEGGDYSSGSLVTGKPAVFSFRFNGDASSAMCQFTIYSTSGQAIASFRSDKVSEADEYSLKSSDQILCRFRDLLLLPGSYTVNVAARVRGELQDHVQRAFAFTVEASLVHGRPVSGAAGYGDVTMEHTWMFPGRIPSESQSESTGIVLGECPSGCAMNRSR